MDQPKTQPGDIETVWDRIGAQAQEHLWALKTQPWPNKPPETPSPPATPSRPPRCVPRDEAARYCDLSPNSFQREVAAGRLPKPIRFGGRVVWDIAALDRALDNLGAQGPANGTGDPLQVEWANVGKNALHR